MKNDGDLSLSVDAIRCKLQVGFDQTIWSTRISSLVMFCESETYLVIHPMEEQQNFDFTP